jgi:hypothetical protein
MAQQLTDDEKNIHPDSDLVEGRCITCGDYSGIDEFCPDCEE